MKITCNWHLCTNQFEEKSHLKKKYCSRECKNKGAVHNRRKALKQQAISYLGGCCEACDYNKYVGALTFHHVDASQKAFGISHKGTTKSWKRLQPELDKCILLCHNCHAELHGGVNIWLSR